MIAKLLSKFRKPKPQTTELFKAAGHTFRILNPTTMSNVRKTRFFFEEYAREWGMTKQDILDFDGIILKECEAPASRSIHDLNSDLTNKLARIKTLVSIRSAMIIEDYQYKPFLRSACSIILMDDEDENKIDNQIVMEKLRLCSQYPEIEAFFLRACRTFQLSTKDSQDISKIWEWLPSTEHRIMENIVLKEIGQTVYSSGTL
jgi:hypothetical protein